MNSLWSLFILYNNVARKKGTGSNNRNSTIVWERAMEAKSQGGRFAEEGKRGQALHSPPESDNLGLSLYYSSFFFYQYFWKVLQQF